MQRDTRTYPNLAAFFRDNPDQEQRQVAKDVGCADSHLSMIKNGERQPTLKLALRIARRCRVPLESLVQPEPKLAHSRG